MAADFAILAGAYFNKVKESMPRLRPVAMLKVSWVAIMVRKAGDASLKCRERPNLARSNRSLLF
jgi:hypothetical protein